MSVKELCNDSSVSSGQFVLVQFYGYRTTLFFDYFSLIRTTRKVIEKTGVGEIYRIEIPWDDIKGYMYLKGPDAKKIAEVLIPLFRIMPLMKNAKVFLHYGSPDDANVLEEVIQIG